MSTTALIRGFGRLPDSFAHIALASQTLYRCSSTIEKRKKQPALAGLECTGERLERLGLYSASEAWTLAAVT